MSREIDQELEALLRFQAWREQLVANGPDYSIEAYGRHLAAQQVDEHVNRIIQTVGEGLANKSTDHPYLERIDQILVNMPRLVHDPLTERSPE